MRSYGHLWLFVFLGLIGFDGPRPDAADPGDTPSREADAPVLASAAVALPACPRTPAGDRDHGGCSATVAAVAPDAPPCPGSLHARAAEWLSFRRPFAETVSYRTTAPPARIA